MSAASQTPEAHDTGKTAETSTKKRTKKRHIRPDAVVGRKYGFEDADLLECPLCFECLDSPPIYQCQNGHIACSACCEKLQQGNKGCPTCSLPTGSIRCISRENILASLEVSCKYARYGCGFMMSRKSCLKYHECCCEYEPYPCPFPECVYEGSHINLPLHLAEVHKVPTVEYNYISGTGFSMTPADRMVAVKFEKSVGTWSADMCFVHREPVRDFISGDLFFCTYMGLDYPKCFHLKVAYQDSDFDAVSYSMRSKRPRSLQDARDYLMGDFLILPLRKFGSVQSGAEPNELPIEVYLKVSDWYGSDG